MDDLINYYYHIIDLAVFCSLSPIVERSRWKISERIRNSVVLVYVIEEEVEVEHVITTGKGKEEKLCDIIWGLVEIELDNRGKGVVAHALGFFR